MICQCNPTISYRILIHEMNLIWTFLHRGPMYRSGAFLVGASDARIFVMELAFHLHNTKNQKGISIYPTKIICGEDLQRNDLDQLHNLASIALVDDS